MMKGFVPEFFLEGFSILGFEFPGLKDCPKTHIEIGGIGINWPTLIPLCLLGALIGFGYYSTHRKNPYSKISAAAFYSYQLSFFLFGCMNIDAVIYHCFVGNNLQPSRLFEALDVACTSASSFSLFWASLISSGKISEKQGASLLNLVVLLIFVSSGIGNYLEIPFVGALLYTHITALAIVGVYSLELLNHRSTSFILNLTIALFIMLLGGGSLLVNEQLCSSIGPHFSSAFSWFLACDLGFLFVWRMLNTLQNETSNSSQKQQSQSQQQNGKRSKKD